MAALASAVIARNRIALLGAFRENADTSGERGRTPYKEEVVGSRPTAPTEIRAIEVVFHL